MSSTSEPTKRGEQGVPDDPLTDHNYDGIQEYDNPTPGWWVWLFIATIVFSVLYMAVMFLTVGQLSPAAHFRRDNIAAMRAHYGQLAGMVPDTPTLLALSRDERWLGVGQGLYLANCASCHAADGSGISAANLTDEAFMHVREPADVFDVVAVGRRAGAMPAFQNRMPEVEQMLVSAYVVSLRGKNLRSVGGRPPEGQEIPPWNGQ